MKSFIKGKLYEILDKKITCEKCGWKESDTAKSDMYICRKCGNDNSLNENLQQADKLYFNTGKLPREFRETLVNITNGGPYTKLVADLVYHMSKFGKLDNGTIRLGEQLFSYLKNYDKNIFPLKYDITQYGADENTPNERHILTLYEILRERHFLINEFRRLPSIGSRNLRQLTKTHGNNGYEFKLLADKLNKINRAIKFIPDTERGVKILNKVFNSNNTLDKMIEIAEYYQNAFTNHNEEDKDDLIDAVQMLNAEIVQNTNRLLVIKVNDQEAMQRIGCTSAWCFALPNSDDFWESYANLGYVYVIFDFKMDTDDAKFLMVLLPDSNEVYSSTNVPLEDIGVKNGYQYLMKIGVKLDAPKFNQTKAPKNEPKQLSLFEIKRFIKESLRIN